MANAPRFLSWWEHAEDTSVHRMRKEYWNSVVGHTGTPVKFDVRSTPMSRLSDVCSIVGAIAHDFGNATARYTVLRYDPADAPNSINLDDYVVWTDLRAHPALKDMITAASTSDNENFKSFCSDYIFFVKQAPGPDHRLPSIPSSMSSILKST